MNKEAGLGSRWVRPRRPPPGCSQTWVSSGLPGWAGWTGEGSPVSSCGVGKGRGRPSWSCAPGRRCAGEEAGGATGTAQGGASSSPSDARAPPGAGEHLPPPSPAPCPTSSAKAAGGGGPAASSWLQGGHLPRCPLPRPPQCAGERRARQMAWLRMRRRCREVRAGTGDMRLRASWCHWGGGGEAGEV